MTLTPQPGWVLCKALRPAEMIGKLHAPIDHDKTVSEGVAEVVEVSSLHRVRQSNKESAETFPQNELKKGDKVIYRGFLRYAHQVGEMFGGRPTDFFFLQMGDVLAVVEGQGTVGFYGEFQV